MVVDEVYLVDVIWDDFIGCCLIFVSGVYIFGDFFECVEFIGIFRLCGVLLVNEFIKGVRLCYLKFLGFWVFSFFLWEGIWG